MEKASKEDFLFDLFPIPKLSIRVVSILSGLKYLQCGFSLIWGIWALAVLVQELKWFNCSKNWGPIVMVDGKEINFECHWYEAIS